MGKKAKEKEIELAASRRNFLTTVWVGFGFVAVVEIAWLVVSFLRPGARRIKESDPAELITAGPVESFEPGTVTAFPRGRFYLARLEDNGFLAISRTCTHLGCTVPWIETEDKFACPCHASAFDITGNVLGGPAPRPLDLHPVSIENNVVRVNIRKRIRRTEFREDQVVYPKRI
jgi:cytochrome b6-f complex iron-sulfur subunit